ncbi:MATE family efflux transporter [uncultured Methanobrevibacter sp.]|uniref:MATE family efflux transporter n=2 Tax=uncultured Methanobrevibacter sp. TaxID=253161 RepID=UPI0025DDA340|nr:MATE family efflux transporter [uncultured Methanobrevibacter sp.]MCI6994601.1 MATE family efflux transporter [Methanobrevibacter sp.]
MIVSLLLTMINNVADAMWVSGLGSDALAAIGIVTPIFIIIIGLGIGISAGVNSSVARFIGKGDLKQAGNSGVHGLIISIIISIIIPVILLVFLKQILIAIGGASVLDLAYDYGFWIIIGAFSVIVQYVFSGVYRSENKGIKSNFPLALAAILNICLDPIFIYTFNMGVAGAAIATVLSNIISLMLFIYWRYIKGGELLDLNTYNKNMSIYKDIISVGVPASMEQILMSLFSMIINVILVMVATTEAVAVYTTVWRLISIGVMIPVGFGTGSISIFGALFGARKSETILESFKFTQIIGFVGSVLMAIILAIFSPLLALLFGGAGLNDQIISITVLLSLYVVFSSWSIVSGCILQSFGRGDYSLYFTFFKQIILTLIFIFLFIGLKETGVYYGIIAANFVGGVIEIIFTYIYVKRIQKYYK